MCRVSRHERGEPPTHKYIYERDETDSDGAAFSFALAARARVERTFEHGNAAWIEQAEKLDADALDVVDNPPANGSAFRAQQLGLLRPYFADINSSTHDEHDRREPPSFVAATRRRMADAEARVRLAKARTADAAPRASSDATESAAHKSAVAELAEAERAKAALPELLRDNGLSLGLSRADVEDAVAAAEGDDGTRTIDTAVREARRARISSGVLLQPGAASPSAIDGDGGGGGGALGALGAVMLVMIMMMLMMLMMMMMMIVVVVVMLMMMMMMMMMIILMYHHHQCIRSSSSIKKRAAVVAAVVKRASVVRWAARRPSRARPPGPAAVGDEDTRTRCPRADDPRLSRFGGGGFSVGALARSPTGAPRPCVSAARRTARAGGQGPSAVASRVVRFESRADGDLSSTHPYATAGDRDRDRDRGGASARGGIRRHVQTTRWL